MSRPQSETVIEIAPRRPWSAPAFAVGVVLGAGLLLVALRVTSAPPKALADAPRSAVTAREAAAPVPSAPPAPAPFDLAYVPADAVGVVAVRPGALLDQPGVRPWFDLLRTQGEVAQQLMIAAALGVPVDGVDQLLYVQLRPGVTLAGDNSDLAEAFLLSGGLILRLARPFDAKRLAAAAPGFEMSSSEATYAGRSYHRLRVGEKLTVGVYQPDETTVIAALESNLFRFMARANESKAEHPWSETWRRVARGHLALAVDVGFFRGLLEPALQADDGAALYAAPCSPLWEETTTQFLALDLTDGVALDSLAVCGTVDGAESVAQTSQALLTLSQNGSRGVAKRLPALLHSGSQGTEGGQVIVLLRLVELGAEIARGARVERDGSVVRFHASARFDLAATVQSFLTLLR